MCAVGVRGVGWQVSPHAQASFLVPAGWFSVHLKHPPPFVLCVAACHLMLPHALSLV